MTTIQTKTNDVNSFGLVQSQVFYIKDSVYKNYLPITYTNFGIHNHVNLLKLLTALKESYFGKIFIILKNQGQSKKKDSYDQYHKNIADRAKRPKAIQ